MQQSTLTKSQKRTERKSCNYQGESIKAKLNIRYDDQCGNGHNSFGMTLDISLPRGREISGGADMEGIKKIFPKFAKYIKWHLCSSDGPMHYIANTMYHASNKDHNGLRKGEIRQIRNGKTKKLCWKLKEYPMIDRYKDSDEKPILPELLVEYVPWCRTGEGKEIDINAARSCAVWPKATLEQLQDKKQLEARLSKLLEDFSKDMESLGFTY